MIEISSGDEWRFMKKALIVATTASMIDQFNMPNIHILQKLGYEVSTACNINEGNTTSKERINEFLVELEKLEVKHYDICFPRSPYKVRRLCAAYKALKKIIMSEQYDLIHCHTPVGGLLTRIIGKRAKSCFNVRIIYTAHGFHFFKGAPVKNWLLYFPVEWICSHWTDVLVTINREDYCLARRYMKAKKVEYIPGVGVDTKKFSECSVDVIGKRRELNIPVDKFVLLSVGELHARKNQQVVIEALHRLNDKDIYYLLVGKGELYESYKSMIDRYSLENNIRLLGFREDIDELCKIADCFVHPSIREGLGIAPLEAMACGLPLIVSNVNGIKDYAKNGISGYCVNPISVEEMCEAINRMKTDKGFRDRCGVNNVNIAKQFDVLKSAKIIEEIYSEDNNF